MGGVRTGCLGLFGFRLITFWSVCVGGVQTDSLGLFGFRLVAFWFVCVHTNNENYYVAILGVDFLLN